MNLLGFLVMYVVLVSVMHRNYFVEMNLDLMKASVPYIRSLQV